MWYYFLPSKIFFKKLFQKQFLKNIFTFRSLLAFFHLLERNILVLLVRSTFVLNFSQAYYFIKAGFVFINGFSNTRNFYTTKVGDIFELFLFYYQSIIYLYCSQLLSFTSLRHEYFLKLAHIGQFFFFEAEERKQDLIVYEPETQYLDLASTIKKKIVPYWLKKICVK